VASKSSEAIFVMLLRLYPVAAAKLSVKTVNYTREWLVNTDC
jgi:hypothetical protein